ncbi:MAG: peptidylprolyl isomerase [Acidobacteriota bacterium]|nr:MAG: peptidylprolyl isomerase [Acidobacteriota bacterium]
MKRTSLIFAAICLSAVFAAAQVPVNTQIQIVKAEDARRYDATLENLLRSPNADVRRRAALAAGRIGNEAAIPVLAELLASDGSNAVRAMAAFAIGEIESVKGAEAILKQAAVSLDREAAGGPAVIARAVEAAGKIAAANAKDPSAAKLSEAIIAVLAAESELGKDRNADIVLAGITAVLRARPAQGEQAAAAFLTDADARIRADAANTLGRLRAKIGVPTLRSMLASDPDAVARANAARVLGVSEDKSVVPDLIAALKDRDTRVRVSAIRSLATLRDKAAVEPLIAYGEALLQAYKKAKKLNFYPVEENEFIELATALGQLIPNSFNESALNLIREFGKLDKGFATEVYVARLRIAPGRGDQGMPELEHWKQYRTLVTIVGEFAGIEPATDEGKAMKAEAPSVLKPLAEAFAEADPKEDADTILAGADALRAYGRFFTDDLDELLRLALKNKDVQIRTAAASLLGERPTTEINVAAVRDAFFAAKMDRDNDAQLAMLAAVVKLDKAAAEPALRAALDSVDHLVRKRAAELIRLNGLDDKFPGYRDKAEPLRAFAPGNPTRMGQIIYRDADYRRAVSRKNGSVKAVLTTQKGRFTIDLLPEDAPLTVDNFITLARRGYFNGLAVHRVVPNFVMQDGDPRGDGTGGPGWSIRCEVNTVMYERGVVGMALSGKDTGGSQWFVTHAPQPHLDGGYTVFGRVNENDMKVVDNIVRGDKILSVRIVGR